MCDVMGDVIDDVMGDVMGDVIDDVTVGFFDGVTYDVIDDHLWRHQFPAKRFRPNHCSLIYVQKLIVFKKNRFFDQLNGAVSSNIPNFSAIRPDVPEIRKSGAHVQTHPTPE